MLNCLAIVLLLMFTVTYGQNSTDDDARMPPAITSSSPQQIYFRTDVTDVATLTRTLECEFNGIPTPTFQWYKNSMKLNITMAPNIKVKIQGTITISPITAADAGYYQCFVSNKWGTAATDVTFLQLASLSPFKSDPRSATVQQGQKAVLRCTPPQSVPAASYSWYLPKNDQDQFPASVKTDRRVQVDQQQGDLYFAYTIVNDTQNKPTQYRCGAYNPYLGSLFGGSLWSLTVTGDTSLQPVSPTIAFSTSSPTTALTGQSVKLACFFYGYPAPTITWSKDGGALPTDGYQTINDGSTLQITNVSFTDQGTYECVGSNGPTTNSARATIQLYVESKPAFQTNNSKPVDTIATVGQTVNFTCDAASIPAPDIVWYINTVPLNPAGLPGRFSLSSDQKLLTISNVCKTCSGGTSDLQVFQCNASNENGYVYSSGYLNVYEPTIITDPPLDQNLEANAPTILSCPSSYDASTSVTVEWYFNGVPLVSDANLVYTDTEGNLHINTPKLPDGGASYSGNYTCVVSNKYSSDQASVVISPVIGVYTASIADFWWVFLIFFILLLLVFGVFAVIWYMRQNRGDSYPVDDKERENGNDPDRELKDNAFQDYQRADTAPLITKPAGSATGTLNLTSDDGTSFSDYNNDVFRQSH